jgi:2,4-dienoyl-CoA reductase-like NADH-dependent reductase (Old Yellow Enzyme family)
MNTAALSKIVRLLLEVTAAVKDEIGAERTGVRISPVSPANAISCSDPQPQYDYLAEQLDALGIVYLHVVEGATGGREMYHRSITTHYASALKTPGSATMAMTWRWRPLNLRKAKPICSRLVARSSPIRIWSKG